MLYVPFTDVEIVCNPVPICFFFLYDFFVTEFCLFCVLCGGSSYQLLFSLTGHALLVSVTEVNHNYMLWQSLLFLNDRTKISFLAAAACLRRNIQVTHMHTNKKRR